ncbi:MAG: biliverdin-producing heme oxygenase [Nonlabens sp.]
MDTLSVLRKETRAIHDRLEKLSGVDLIIDGTVTTSQYNTILKNNYHSYHTVERNLKPYGYISKYATRILKDLNETDEELPAANINSYSLDSELEALGATYVILGSQMGAAIIARALEDCKFLINEPQQFYRKPTAFESKQWPHFLKQMNSVETSTTNQWEIISGALKTFSLFEQQFTDHPVQR